MALGVVVYILFPVISLSVLMVCLQLFLKL